MNTFWPKIAGGLVVVVIIVVASSYISGCSSEPNEPDDGPTSFEDVKERDRQFLEMPEPHVEQPDVQEPETEPETPESEVVAELEPAGKYVLPSTITERTVLYFKNLDEIDEIEAERIFNAAAPGRSIGRLQVGYTMLMEGAEQILNKWPDSVYAFRIKQLLEDVPERYWERYDITEEKLDISMYLEQREGTTGFDIDPIR